jgi:hypothetical protein
MLGRVFQMEAEQPYRPMKISPSPIPRLMIMGLALPAAFWFAACNQNLGQDS